MEMACMVHPGPLILDYISCFPWLATLYVNHDNINHTSANGYKIFCDFRNGSLRICYFNMYNSEKHCFSTEVFCFNSVFF